MKFKTKITPYFLITIAITTLHACKKSDTPTPTPTPVTPVETIYTVGYERSPNAPGHYIAKYWKDTTAVNLTVGSTDAQARSITVVGNDVYVSGYETSGAVLLAKYWKNGAGVTLSTTDPAALGIANSIFVSGSNVFVAGSEVINGKSFARYWKNGTGINLQENAVAKSIVVSGSDVYIAGEQTGNPQGPTVYWKNGTPVNLSLESGSTAYPASIALSGSDVYVSGTVYTGVNSKPAYWKNGAKISLSASNLGIGNGIAVSGSDLYVAGNINVAGSSVGKFWKNDIENDLTNPGTTLSAHCLGIFALSNNVYIAGDVKTSVALQSMAAYWKNGKEVRLTSGERVAGANGIFVTIK